MSSSNLDTAGVAGPPPLIVSGPLLIGLALHRLRPMSLLPKAIARPFGWLLLIGGVAGMIWSFLTFQRQGTPIDPNQPVNNLITSGPFQYTRNPSYASLIAMYLGITNLVNTIWPLLLLPVTLLALTRGVIEREERYLEEKFGDEYRRYTQQVGRWY